MREKLLASVEYLTARFCYFCCCSYMGKRSANQMPKHDGTVMSRNMLARLASRHSLNRSIHPPPHLERRRESNEPVGDRLACGVVVDNKFHLSSYQHLPKCLTPNAVSGGAGGVAMVAGFEQEKCFVHTLCYALLTVRRATGPHVNRFVSPCSSNIHTHNRKVIYVHYTTHERARVLFGRDRRGPGRGDGGGGVFVFVVY